MDPAQVRLMINYRFGRDKPISFVGGYRLQAGSDHWHRPSNVIVEAFHCRAYVSFANRCPDNLQLHCVFWEGVPLVIESLM
jgi:hypothetical protein